MACRDARVTPLEASAEAGSRIGTVVNDSVGSSKLSRFKKKFSDCVINIGLE